MIQPKTRSLNIQEKPNLKEERIFLSYIRLTWIKVSPSAHSAFLAICLISVPTIDLSKIIRLKTAYLSEIRHFHPIKLKQFLKNILICIISILLREIVNWLKRMKCTQECGLFQDIMEYCTRKKKLMA